MTCVSGSTYMMLFRLLEERNPLGMIEALEMARKSLWHMIGMTDALLMIEI